MKTASFFSKIALFTLLVFLAPRLGAQESAYRPVPVKISHTIDTVAGKVYFVHTVQRGHTLYSICRAYQTTAETLLKDSPESQVQADEFIYIPFNPSLWENQTQPEPFTGKRPFVVLALLPQTDEKPSFRQEQSEPAVIQTDEPEPLSKATSRRERREERAAAKAEERADLQNEENETSQADEAQMLLNDSIAPALELREKDVKDTLRISLLLPLYSHTPQDPKAYVYLPFFEGASVAWQEMLDPEFFTPATDTTLSVDSLAIDSIPMPKTDLTLIETPADSLTEPAAKLPFLQLKLFDLTSSVESIDEIMADEYFLQSDAVIATAFVEHFERLDSVSRIAGIPLIHPVSERDSLCVGNPYLIQLAASYATQLNQLAEFVQRKYAKARILIISDSTQSEIDKADRINGLIYKSERFYFNDATAEMLEALTENSKHPVVILPFYRKEISAVKTVLPLRQNKGNITIIAPAVWLDYGTIDLDYFIQNHLTVYNTFYGIHQNPDFMDFSKKHYFLYRGLPNALAYQGYCVMRWLIDMLHTFNADFMRHIDTESAHLQSHPFYRLEPKETGGFENRNIPFIRIEQDGMERVTFKPFAKPRATVIKESSELEEGL